MNVPFSRTYCSYSQVDVQMSPFINSPTSIVNVSRVSLKLLATYSRKPENYNGTIIFEFDIMKN